MHETRLEPREEAMPRCPWCGEECEHLYRDRAGTILGCENCIEDLNAYDNRSLAG